MSPRRMREWPRLIGALVVLGVVLLGVGLLVGSTALGQGGSTTTTTTATTMTTTVAQQGSSSGATKALVAERVAVRKLHRELRVARTRLRRAAHAHHSASTHKTQPHKGR